MAEHCFETCCAPAAAHGRSYLTFRRIIYQEFADGLNLDGSGDHNDSVRVTSYENQNDIFDSYVVLEVILDINNDKKKDIIIIKYYVVGMGWNGMKPRSFCKTP